MTKSFGLPCIFFGIGGRALSTLERRLSRWPLAIGPLLFWCTRTTTSQQ